MPHDYEDLEQVVYPLMRIGQTMRRAQNKAIDPTRQAILQQAAVKQQVRPSELAAELDLYPSSITRQTRSLEDDGLIAVEADPADRRSCLISLTEAGWDEVRTLTRIGLDRFADFMAGWDAEDVRTLGRLLTRLETSVDEAKRRTQRPGGRPWQQRTGGE
ncbi:MULTISPECIES: MarR family winged helix-turn-helix transcriptional regulator [unclassified Amycolatopsis]|uniref:MarR family winged helix-turn-helix transcriptional regulator n=1 Tax=unclassified Amycolatopsis TaxID=2618356 RepID=UPI002E14AF45|nr:MULTISPECIES: MarR family winged helix-turn-helix transcriptional regulator [unclassified Amycolatopsis]WSK77763.1 MarR family winged helix-turn-helix transcriptional regulator [Amycolatopsis sp. NBC_01286]